MLTFAIRPGDFVDDGPEALEALKARMAAEKEARKAARKIARQRGLLIADDEDEEEE